MLPSFAETEPTDVVRSRRGWSLSSETRREEGEERP